MNTGLHLGSHKYTFSWSGFNRSIFISLVAVWCVFTLAPLGRAAWVPTEDATVIFANYDPNPTGSPVGLSGRSGGGPRYHVGPWAGLRDGVGFTTDANAYCLDALSVCIRLQYGPTNAYENDLIVSLYSDDAGAPGASLGVLSWAGFAGSSPFFRASGLALAPSTTYWVVAEPSVLETVDFQWFPSSTSGFGSSSELDFSETFWHPWDNYTTSFSPALAVYGTPVPEPSSLTVVALGAATVCFMRRHLWQLGCDSRSQVTA
jgi:hypothetical protein